MSPALQAVITLLLVGMAAAYLGRVLFRQLRSRDEAGCAQCSRVASRRLGAPDQGRPSSPPHRTSGAHDEPQ
jgi:hypothetical protein